jgi:hypothetical protein
MASSERDGRLHIYLAELPATVGINNHGRTQVLAPWAGLGLVGGGVELGEHADGGQSLGQGQAVWEEAGRDAVVQILHQDDAAPRLGVALRAQQPWQRVSNGHSSSGGGCCA